MLPDPLIVYLDENHCNNHHILRALQEAGIQTERHLQHFQRGTADELWLPFVGTKGWVLLTTDARIRHRANERRAVIENRVRMFYFSNNNMSGRQMGEAVEKALPGICRLCSKHPAPFFAAIARSGEVYLKDKLAKE